MTNRKRSNSAARAALHNAISRRDFLRVGGMAIPAAVMLPAWMSARAATSATTFDYYISTSGSDNNPGTLAAPWAITSLISTSPNNSKMASKRVGFLPGTYKVAGTSGVSGATFIGSGNYPTNGSYCALSIPGGSSGSPTYIGTSDSTGNYSPRTATIFVAAGQAAGTNKWNNAILGTDAGNVNYVTIDGIVINGNGMDCVGPNGNEGAHLIMTQGSGGSFTSPGNQLGFSVVNCELFGITASDSGGNDAAIFLSGNNGGLVQNCYIHDIVKSDQFDHAHGSEMYGCTGVRFLNNTFSNCNAIEPKEGCSNITAAYNYFFGCSVGGSGNAAVLQGWDGAEGNPNSPNTPYSIHHNVFDGCGRITFGESNNAGHSMNISWFNNTIYDTRTGVSGTVVLNSINSAVIQHFNNLYVLAKATGVSGFASFTSGFVSPIGYDCVYAPSAASYAGVFTNGTAWLTGRDPQFTGGTANITSGKGPNQFQVAAGSVCINAGHVGGTAAGAQCNVGAWDGTVTQIGCTFAPGSAGGAGNVIPDAPTLTVS